MKDTTLHKLVSNGLRVGIYTSGILIVAGVVLMILFPSSGVNYPKGWDFLRLFDPQHIDASLLSPPFYLFCGIVILMLTPIARVVITLLAFFQEKDWKYVAISALVLLIISTSIAVSLLP